MSNDPDRPARSVELPHAHPGVVRKLAALLVRDRADRNGHGREFAPRLDASSIAPFAFGCEPACVH
ncbi:MAG: hypothetical protein HZA52_16325 [Planctomycetes bacterium]|nr:hypothetical protein [Planctomycetota bacterium]